MTFKITKTAFEKFCRVKPKDEEYDYGSNLNCALAQYLRGEDVGFISAGGTTVFVRDENGHKEIEIPNSIRDSLVERPRTFGNLANRLKRARETKETKNA